MIRMDWLSDTSDDNLNRTSQLYTKDKQGPGTGNPDDTIVFNTSD